jgi:hypothetical protein
MKIPSPPDEARRTEMQRRPEFLFRFRNAGNIPVLRFVPALPLKLLLLFCFRNNNHFPDPLFQPRATLARLNGQKRFNKVLSIV